METAPGDQLQIDFGQKRLVIAGVRVRIFLLVAVLSYSRRLFANFIDGSLFADADNINIDNENRVLGRDRPFR